MERPQTHLQTATAKEAATIHKSAAAAAAAAAKSIRNVWYE